VKASLESASGRARLLARLRSLQPDDARRWGRMTAHQMVCHLADSFRAMLGQKAVSPNTNWLKRTVLKWLALNAPIPWPHGYPTRPEMDQQKGGTRPVEFVRDVADLERLVEDFSAKPAGFAWHPHPGFGLMTTAEYMRWGWLHMDHHLRQFGR
jgi:hypothetical protein